jgi:hypothetical protein
MSNYSSEYRDQDFCAIDEGLDYIFARMGAIYGAVFVRHWEGVDHQLVRQVWAEECGRMLTYKPKLDYALQHMNPDRPPSALAFKKLLNDAPRIPDKPHSIITRQPTLHEKMATEKAKAEAMAKLRELTEQMRMPK